MANREDDGETESIVALSNSLWEQMIASYPEVLRSELRDVCFHTDNGFVLIPRLLWLLTGYHHSIRTSH
jgi:hypothetical protein